MLVKNAQTAIRVRPDAHPHQCWRRSPCVAGQGTFVGLSPKKRQAGLSLTPAQVRSSTFQNHAPFKVSFGPHLHPFTPLLFFHDSYIPVSTIYISPVVKKILLISYWNYYDKHSLNFFQIECTFKKSEHISPLEILVHLVCTFLGISERRVTEYVL